LLFFLVSFVTVSPCLSSLHLFSFFSSNESATSHIYTLSLHDALPIFSLKARIKDTFFFDEGGVVYPMNDRKNAYISLQLYYLHNDLPQVRVQVSHRGKTQRISHRI